MRINSRVVIPLRILFPLHARILGNLFPLGINSVDNTVRTRAVSQGMCFRRGERFPPRDAIPLPGLVRFGLSFRHAKGSIPEILYIGGVIDG